MRSSCETAWLENYPVASVAGWLGHSREVCMKHYAQVLPEHFESVVNGAKENPAQNPAQQVSAKTILGVAGSRTAKFEADENTHENNCFQAKTEDAEETKNRGGEIRTPDLLVPNQARYQLRYAPFINQIPTFAFLRASSIAHIALFWGANFFSIKYPRCCLFLKCMSHLYALRSGDLLKQTLKLIVICKRNHYASRPLARCVHHHFCTKRPTQLAFYRSHLT